MAHGTLDWYQRDLCILKRDPSILKRDLFMIKRDLHDNMKCVESSQVSLMHDWYYESWLLTLLIGIKETYVSWKETYILWKETYPCWREIYMTTSSEWYQIKTHWLIVSLMHDWYHESWRMTLLTGIKETYVFWKETYIYMAHDNLEWNQRDLFILKRDLFILTETFIYMAHDILDCYQFMSHVHRSAATETSLAWDMSHITSYLTSDKAPTNKIVPPCALSLYRFTRDSYETWHGSHETWVKRDVCGLCLFIMYYTLHM